MEKSFIRWQNISLKQLSYSNNLFIGLAIALISYIFNIISNVIELTNCQKIFFWLSLISLIVSTSAGICLSIKRLKNFKITAQIARNKEKKDIKNLENLRKISKRLGELTWYYFYLQVGAFIVGFILTTIFIILIYSNKIL